MGASGSKTKNVLLPPTVSDVCDLEKVFERMYSCVSLSCMFLTLTQNELGSVDITSELLELGFAPCKTEQNELGSVDISGVPLEMQDKMLASRAGGMGQVSKSIPIRSVFPLLLHDREGGACTNCWSAPDIKDRLLEVKAAYLACFTARMKDPNCSSSYTSDLREVESLYIDELCTYDEAFAEEQSIGIGVGHREDCAKAEFLFGVLFMTCSSAAHVREAERKAKLIGTLVMISLQHYKVQREKYKMTWELTKSNKDDGDSLNERCLASLFTYGLPSTQNAAKDGNSEVAYGLLARFIESPRIAESLENAPALRNALFDALVLIREYNGRHLLQYTVDIKADKNNLFGALASALAQSHKEEGRAEVCAGIDAYTAAKKTEMIAAAVDRKAELHAKSEKALARVLEVLETKCGHDGIVRSADIKRWTESKPAPAPVKL